MTLRADNTTQMVVASVLTDGEIAEYECRFSACANPVCNCAELTLEMTPTRHIANNARPPLRRAVVIDLTRGELVLADREKVPEADREFARLFFGQLGDEDFKILHQKYFALKLDATRKSPARAVDADFDYHGIETSGLKTVYNDVLPFGEQLQLNFNGKECILFDQYCLASHCECSDVVIVACEIAKATPLKEMFGIIVDYRTKQWKREGPTSPQNLSEVRGAIEDAFPDLYGRLKERHKRIKEIYYHCRKRRYTATKTEVPRQKIGRNTLCPCGSGKKYKRCCGRG